ncbi:cAMP-dependent protein kinase catalytic subunit PRKX [Aduncisulcus paluster]|uniref:cAMP-dependent protein kinase catalytic subunit PRKX n=1 Tax=Aduncisulcus paluster TaxID=2918883 RepID=A0ABQ5KUE4_9EUKA|nr:cAMP-dependent protein kinase catalytic subunit PRKX [Aduncisulcus paluster]
MDSDISFKELELIKTIGTGTVGRVRLCRHTKTNDFLALKSVHKKSLIALSQVDHIIDELRVLKEVSSHPFIVSLKGSYHDKDYVHMLFEFVPGGELFTYLRKAGKFPLEVAKFYAAELATVLEFLHSKRIVYRDLKPENVLIDKQGHIKLADYGFAKRIKDQTYTLCGTPEYLAPEIIRGSGHSFAVDWWAFGVLIYEMLAGVPPFYGQTTKQTYEKVLRGSITFPPSWDKTTVSFLKALLNPNKAERLGSVRASEVLKHPWFKGVEWRWLRIRLVRPPIIPRVKSAGDTSNFDDFAEDDSALLIHSLPKSALKGRKCPYSKETLEKIWGEFDM